MTGKSSIAQYSLLVLGMGVVIFAAAWALQPLDPPKKRMNAARICLRHVLIALEQYRDDHLGRYPSSIHDGDRGFRDLFNEVKFNEIKECGQISGVEYINVSDSTELNPRQIIVAMRRANNSDFVYFASQAGSIGGWKPICPDSVIGCYLTDDGFIARSETVCDAWEEFSPRGKGWESLWSGTDRILRISHRSNGVVYSYAYTEKEIVVRTILWDGKSLSEKAAFDDCGFIIDVVRSRGDWDAYRSHFLSDQQNH